MDYKESKLQIMLNWVYGIVLATFYWLTGLVLGLGLLGILPATITVFQFLRRLSHDSQRAHIKATTFWWQHYQKNLKKYWQTSLLFSLIAIVLTTNYTFLNLQIGFLTYFLFYMTLFLYLLTLFVFIWFSFLSAYYPEKSQKEILKNAIAYPVSFAIEMLILLVFNVAAYLIVWPLTPGLVIFVGLGASLAAWHWTFKKLHDSSGRYRLKKYWYRTE